MSSLANGSSYFVALSYGSCTGRHDRDAIDEVAMRNPDGGAVAVCGKIVSVNAYAADPERDPAMQFFKRLLDGKESVGEALYGGIMDNDGGLARYEWHLFGDPSMRVGLSPQHADAATATCDGFANQRKPGSAGIDVSVTSYGSPVENARVAIYRDDDVFAYTWTNASGLAEFPSVLLTNVAEAIRVTVIADSSLPATASIPPPTGYQINNTELATPVVYVSHAYSDSAACGAEPDIVEPGDVVDIDVTLKNLASERTAPAGIARLTPSPRVLAAFTIDGAYDSDRIRVGRKEAHPPSAIDTFSLCINEYGLRPEGEPTIDPEITADDAYRDTAFVYHIVLSCTPEDSAKSYAGWLLCKGGMSVGDSLLDPEDSWDVSGDTLTFVFDGDDDRDELLFTARAQEWVSPLRTKLVTIRFLENTQRHVGSGSD